MTMYDRIAGIYDADMGASMTLDDLGYYSRLAKAVDGPVLELGCGSGRVLSSLQAAGVRVVGVDHSLAMLLQAQSRCEPGTQLVQMDMCRLGLRGNFALVLMPYSLITHLLDETDWQALALGLRAAVRRDAKIVIDAFIPCPQIPGSGWLKDYARRVGGQWLVRHKRVSRTAGGIHSIERRYRMKEAFGGRTLLTTERIRPYHPEELVELSRRYIGNVLGMDYDYMPGAEAGGARFCTVTVQWSGGAIGLFTDQQTLSHIKTESQSA